LRPFRAFFWLLDFDNTGLRRCVNRFRPFRAKQK